MQISHSLRVRLVWALPTFLLLPSVPLGIAQPKAQTSRMMWHQQDKPFMACSLIKLEVDFAQPKSVSILFDRNTVSYDEYGSRMVTAARYETRTYVIKPSEGVNPPPEGDLKLYDVHLPPDDYKYLSKQKLRLVLAPPKAAKPIARFLLVSEGENGDVVTQVAEMKGK